MALCMVRRGDDRAALVVSHVGKFVGRLLTGTVICYAFALGVESSAAASQLFIAGMATWYTALLVPVVFPQILRGPSQVWLRRWLHRLESAAVVGALLLVTAECGLRLLDWYSGNPLVPATNLTHLKFAPGTTLRGLTVNRHGYWDEDFRPHTAGKLRVAVLGSDVVLGGDAGTNCLVLLEQRLPNLEVFNFGVSRGGPQHYASQLQEDILPHQPDLVLAFVSIGHDLAVRPAAPPTHDWRELRVLQFRSRHCTPPLAHAAAGFGDPQRPADYESYLRLTSRRLTVCRTPIEHSMKAHWRDTTEQLQRTAAACRDRQLTLGLVLVPGDFQISSALCEAATRRAGLESRQLDLELPQRRLAGFAQQHGLPLIDLTPHLRAATPSPFGRHECDLNEHGQAIASRVIAAWIERRYASHLAALSDDIYP
jgi:hypothetical protein